MNKCRICGVRSIDPDTQRENVDYIRHGRWYVHKSCYEERERRRGNIDIHEEQDDRFWQEASYDYLRKDLKMGVTNLFFKQWKSLIESKNPFYSAKGIYFALRYFYGVKKGDISKANGGIGIVPYVYEDSRTYWYETERKQRGTVAAIEKQMREAMEREKVQVQMQTIKPRKFSVDFSVLDGLEDDDE